MYFVRIVLPLITFQLCTLMSTHASAVPAEGHRIMIAGPSPDSAAIVREIYDSGGNVVDAAVAAVFGMSVTTPYYAALGGGGFALIKFGDQTRALDFRETAYKAANPDLFVKLPPNASIDGGLAVGVPGVVAGLFELHRAYGKLKWHDVMTPAIRLAEKGFLVSGEWAKNTARNQQRFNAGGKKIFFNKDVALLPGDRFMQPQLTKALKLIAAKGVEPFYKGEIGKDILSTVNAAGGKMTSEDLSTYKVRWLEPLHAAFLGYDVALMPPPSSGGIVIAQALQLMDLMQITQKTTAYSVDEYHLLGEIMKLSYRGRSLLGDPDFTKNPIDELQSKKYLQGLAAKIKMDKALDVEPLKNVDFEKGDTTHISVMDAKGDAVSLTLTLNGDYGSGLVSDRFGIALNNQMDDFMTKPGRPNMFGLIQGEANSVRAGARPLSSMSPTIVTKNGKTVLVVGAPGGPRIISAVLQVIYRILAQNLDPDRAIQSPRVHHQFLPNILYVDDLKFTPETLEGLKKRGHQIQTGSTGKVYAVKVGENGILQGAADSRGEGAAGGF